MAACVHLGSATGEKIPCKTCQGEKLMPVFRCSIPSHTECIQGKSTEAVHGCTGCGDFAPAASQARKPIFQGQATISPVEIVKIDSSKLTPHKYHCNCSIFRFRDQLMLAYRVGWAGTHLSVCELDEKTLQPVGESKHMWPHHERCQHGREDPRLFVHNRQLHVFFHGVEVVGGKTVCHPMISRLDNSLQVEHTWCVDYPGRAEWEKNWGPFVWEGELFSVYSINPHVVLHHVGGQAYPFATTERHLPWTGGVLRGGAPPIRVGNEYWSVFHGALNKGLWTYNVGVYAFEARPPFAITRITPDPILWPDSSEPLPDELKGKSVVFPCGAIREGADWLISYGHHDVDCRIARFRHADIERALRPLAQIPGAMQDSRAETLRKIRDTIAPMHGWCPLEKAKLLANLVWEHRPKTIVEIGVWAGRSLLAIALAAKHVPGSQVIGIDPWDKASCYEGDHDPGHVAWLNGFGQDFFDKTHADLESKIKALGLRAKLIRDRANMVEGQFQAIDMLHVDGNHSELASLRDVNLYVPKVKPGGIVVFDDVDWPSTQAALKRMDELCDLVSEHKHETSTYRVYRRK